MVSGFVLDWRGARKACTVGLALLAVLALLALAALPVAAATPEEEVDAVSAIVGRALAAAERGDLAAAGREYKIYDNAWSDIEDDVRAKSRDAYRAIEHEMAAVGAALARNPFDRDALVGALRALVERQREFVRGQPPAANPASSTAPALSAAPTIGSLLGQLNDARSAQSRDDYVAAAASLQRFQATWLDVEGQVKTRSLDDYRQSENDAALAARLLAERQPEAWAVLDRMARRLEPYQAAGRYGVFDATVILLREGLEALLVLVALLAFLRRSGNASQSIWIWVGSAGGLAASVIVGVAIQTLFGALIAPSNRELIEGLTGLVAAAMLLYVSYWLHSNASLGAWQRYVHERTSQALARGSVVGLAFLSFLAVFREGAETVLFFLGMTGNIAPGDLALGLAIGAVFLVALGVLMLKVGLSIPLRPFFAVASLLVFYLCLKFTGTGIHALQVAGMLPATSSRSLPEIGTLGVYPTWEATALQAILVVVGIAIVLRGRLIEVAARDERSI